MSRLELHVLRAALRTEAQGPGDGLEHSGLPGAIFTHEERDAAVKSDLREIANRRDVERVVVVVDRDIRAEGGADEVRALARRHQPAPRPKALSRSCCSVCGCARKTSMSPFV